MKNIKVKFNNSKAITLISLVVTIVIIVILAAVVINMAIGNNGLLSKAKQAKQESINAQEQDKMLLAYYEDYINNMYKDSSRNDNVERESKIITNVNNEIQISGEGKVKVKVNASSSDASKILGYHVIIVNKNDANDVIADMSKNSEIEINNLGIGKIYNVYTVAYDINNNYKVSEVKEICTINVTAESTVKSIKVTANKPNSISGTVMYAFKKDNENYTEWQNDNFYTFNNLYGDVSGVQCKIYVKLKDNNGKLYETTTVAKTSINNDYFVNTANQELATIDGRKFYKKEADPAIAGIANISGYVGVFYVANNQNGVKYYTSYNTSSIASSTSTITYNGVTYYYSAWGTWMGKPSKITTNLKTIGAGQFTNPADVARALLNAYYGNN